MNPTHPSHPLVPRDTDGAYYQAQDAKHCPADITNAVGSVFLEVTSAEHALEVAAQCRGGLDGDDREFFLELGVDAESLLAECRYLVFDTPGLVGMVDIDDLADNLIVTARRTKPGVPCALVVSGVERSPTRLATIIIGPDETGFDEKLWTAHPGLPCRPSFVEPDALDENASITVAELRRRDPSVKLLQIG